MLKHFSIKNDLS